MAHYTYLFLNVFTILIPFLLSFDKKVAYYKSWKFLFPSISLTACLFLVWDAWFTHEGIWGFNPDYLVGIYLFKMPLEEWLFFLTVPYASIFIYECLRAYFPKLTANNTVRFFQYILIVALIVLLIIFRERAYTAINFSFALILLILNLFIKERYMGRFFVFYLIHLIPFLIVNGILTGTMIESPVVWYNPDEIIGLRILTVPVEDTIYSLGLMLMNITLFEFFRNKRVSVDSQA